MEILGGITMPDSEFLELLRKHSVGPCRAYSQLLYDQWIIEKRLEEMGFEDIESVCWILCNYHVPMHGKTLTETARYIINGCRDHIAFNSNRMGGEEVLGFHRSCIDLACKLSPYFILGDFLQHYQHGIREDDPDLDDRDQIWERSLNKAIFVTYDEDRGPQEL